MPKKKQPQRCGAKLKRGGHCKQWPVTGKKRCRLHGGGVNKKTGRGSGAPKGSRNNLKHGIYSSILWPEDREVFDAISLGSIDDEIRILRVRLRRALIEQGKQDQFAKETDPEKIKGQLEIDEIKISRGRSSTGAPVQSTEVKRTRKDYSKTINSLIKLIADLELRKIDLQAQAPGDPGEIARQIREAYEQMDAVTAPPPTATATTEEPGK